MVSVGLASVSNLYCMNCQCLL